MEDVRAAAPTRTSRRDVALIAALLATWLFVLVLSWDPPWNTVSVDDFTRIELALEWADRPFWAEPGLLWLPGHTYVLGAVFAVAGSIGEPLGIAAVVNTAAIAASALLFGATARRVFASSVGALVVVAATLTVPWSRFLALSGLVEPLYIAALATTVYATVRWVERGDGVRWLAVAVTSLTALCLVRYEGWAVWAVWLLMVGVRLREAEPRHWLRCVTIAALPALIPIAWMAANWIRFDDPTAFAATTETLFRSGFGGSVGGRFRIGYYPLAALRADAPLTIGVAGAAIATWWRWRIARPILTVIVGSSALLWASSILTGTIGLQPERFVYPYVLGLIWTLPALGLVVRRSAGRELALAVAIPALVLFFAISLLRSHPPIEWNYAPDLLESASLIADSEGIDTVAIPDDLPNEDAPIAVIAGRAVEVTAVPSDTLGDLVDSRPGLIALDRIPTRISRLPKPPVSIGRYALYPGGTDLAAADRCGECDGWVLEDENGSVRTLDGSQGMLGLELTVDNPPGGARAELRKAIPLLPSARRGSLQYVALYGRGFNRGRLTVEVTLSGVVLDRRDVAAHGGWQGVSFEVPAGIGTADLVVAVVAADDIEETWGWGRASGVLVRGINLGDAPRAQAHTSPSR